jgi:hypothetical protein
LIDCQSTFAGTETPLREHEAPLDDLARARRAVSDEHEALERTCRERQERLEQGERELDRRGRELNHFARHLRRLQAQLLRPTPPAGAAAGQEAPVAERNAVVERPGQEPSEQARIAQEKAERNRLREEIRLARDAGPRQGNLRERLAHIHRLKAELAASAAGSGSAPGDQVRC